MKNPLGKITKILKKSIPKKIDQRVPATDNISPEVNQSTQPPETQSSAIPVSPPASPIAPLPKKGFPKRILVAIGIIFVVIVSFFLLKNIASRFQAQKDAEITWWGVSFNEEAVAGLISEYELNNPKTKINYVKQSPQDYRERLANSLAKGQGPDIFEMHNTWVPMLSPYLDVLPTSVMNSADYAKTFYPVVLDDMSSKNGFVGVPLAYDALTLFVNEEIFERENKTVPTTWDGVKDISTRVTKRDENDVITQAGVAIGRTENVDYWQEILAVMFLQNGADLSFPANESAQDALNYFISFSKDDEGVWDTTMPSSTRAFAAGKLAMLLAPGKSVDEIKAINSSLRFKTVPFPQVAKALPTQPSISLASYWVESVESKSKKKERAWNFLKFVSEKENLIKLHDAQSDFVGVYPRKDMLELQIEDPFYGSIVKLAPEAKSWYLVSGTNDGETGINSSVSAAYKTAIDGLNNRVTMKKVIEKLVAEVGQALRNFTIK